MKNSDIKISFTGGVNEENIRSFMNEIKHAVDESPNATTLTIYISSLGGNVDIAIELFHFLKLLDCTIRTINVSCVNSAAIIIFAAGKERISLPCSSFYVHSITKNLNGNFTADDLLREAKEMATNICRVKLGKIFFFRMLSYCCPTLSYDTNRASTPFFSHKIGK